MPRKNALPGRLILLGSAYAPLLLIIGCRMLPNKVGWIVLAVGALSIAIWIAFLAWLSQAQPREVALEDFEAIDAEVTGYIASILLPVAAAASPDLGDMVAYAICAVLILIVAFSANLGAANPIVYLARLRVSRVKVDGHPVIALFREAPRSDRTFVSQAAGVVRIHGDVGAGGHRG